MAGSPFTSGAKPRIILVGNPNVGKSVVFGHLTGRYVTVSNYPGTTVEVARGEAILGRERFEVLDTPGVNNLIPLSEEERVTRDILLEEDHEIVVQVADAKNLRRSLLISLQLAEMEIPFLLDLNLMDEAQERGVVGNGGGRHCRICQLLCRVLLVIRETGRRGARAHQLPAPALKEFPPKPVCCTPGEVGSAHSPGWAWTPSGL